MPNADGYAKKLYHSYIADKDINYAATLEKCVSFVQN